MAIVKLDSVYKYFDETAAVDNFSLASEDGEFLVLVGPSGCGKSTTLRMIAGLEDIDHGSLMFDGQPMEDVAVQDRAIAMVFQSYALYPHRNVFNNLGFALKLRGYKKDAIQRAVRSAAQTLEIEALLDRMPRDLSGGQRQRVALGRAIVRAPEVFLMDEPLSNLDAKLRVSMRAEIAKLHRRLGVTTFYVTHDQVEAMTMGDRIVVMNDGVIQQIATPLVLYDHPVNRYVASFIGNPPMNFLTGELNETGDFIQGNGFAFGIDADTRSQISDRSSSAIVAGFRPEHLYQKLDNRDTAGSVVGGTIELVEQLGPTTNIEVHTAGKSLTAALGRDHTLALKDSVELAVMSHCLHLFDAETGQRLNSACKSPDSGRSLNETLSPVSA